MSIILVKKEQKRILIAADSQETYGNDCQENVYDSKLRQVEPDVYVGSAGDAHVCSMFYAYSEQNSISKIQSSMEMVEYFSEFSNWVSEILDLGMEKVSPMVVCQFIIVIKNRAWQFINYYIREIYEGEYASIGSGAQTALACMKLSDSVEEVMKAVCSTNSHCSEPIKIIEIKI